MQTKVKYTMLRVCLLLLFVLSIAAIYHSVFWPKDIDRHVPLLKEVWRKADSCDVLYFAESSNVTMANDDTCFLTISELTAQHFPNVVFGSIDQPAAHASSYLALIRQIPENSRVKTLVVTMNLRSFGAAWIHSPLENNLNRMNVMYGTYPPLINKLRLSLGGYNKKSEELRNADREHSWRYDTLHFPFKQEQVTVRAWDDFVANGYHLNEDGSWNEPKIALACHYVKGYAFQVDTLKNPRIKDFDAIVKVAAAKRLKLVFNLLAENVEYADSLVGLPLTFLMKQNRDLLVKRYTQMGVFVCDNLQSVKGSDFIDQNWTTEHYNLSGRKAIADKLAIALKPLMQ